MKQKTIITLIIVFVFFNKSYNQNLAPNASFETFSSCPNNPGQIYKAVPWTDPTNASSDYFNSCNGGIWGVPNNLGGTCVAKTGVAYAGFNAFPGNREYIQVQMNDTLISGKNYCVYFYLTLADSCPYAANDIGAYFSSTSITGTPGQVLPFIPQVNNNIILNPLTSKNGWTLVIDSFVAVGNELFVTIGNFKDDINTDT